MDGNSLTVVLYKVGQNLNRAYRTCEFFGVDEMMLCDCNAVLTGNLFKAADRVRLTSISEMPEGDNVAYFETNGNEDISEIDWSKIDTVCIGGETNDFRNTRFRGIKKYRINGTGHVSGLTVEAALAIVLFAKSQAK